MRGLALASAAALAAALAGAWVVVAPSAVHAADVDCSSVSGTTSPSPSTSVASAPLSQMGLPLAHADGAGVKVAVVDSDPGFWHGVAMAGLVDGPVRADGGPVGVAPAAAVRLVAAYTAAGGSGSVPTSAGVAGALRGLLTSPPDIVVVPLQVPDSPPLRAAVAALVARGSVVVAAAGDRDTGQASPSPYSGAEDAATSVFPAGYPGVVAVGAALPDPTQVGLANSRTTVAAPVTGAVSEAVGGGTCLVQPSSDVAAAEVGGVMALLRQAFPHVPGSELVSRVVHTASGRPDVSDPFEGAGVVQPLEALTRPLPASAGAAPAGSGTPTRVGRPAALPRSEPDPLRGTRRSAVWWGLGAGGLLVVALLLRPLLARRGASCRPRSRVQ